MRNPKLLLLSLGSLFILLACSMAIGAPTVVPHSSHVEMPTHAPEPTSAQVVALPTRTALAPTVPPTSTPLPTTSPTPTLALDDWQSMPVIPTLSDTALAIYQRGLEMGNDPHAFSKVGDCTTTTSWFLGDFDRGPRWYNLGPYESLSEVIDYFAGSYARESLAVHNGATVASVLSPRWVADKQECLKGETPIACEYRLHKPSFALITLGSNDLYHADTFEPRLREVLDYSIIRGVVPILDTNPDNLEEDPTINAIIAKLAYEYDIPLWNFWLALQPLPLRGMDPDDLAHLSWGPNQFENPYTLQRGYAMRNLTALQVLDSMMRGVQAAQTQP